MIYDKLYILKLCILIILVILLIILSNKSTICTNSMNIEGYDNKNNLPVIYYINLKKEKDRNIHMKRQFKLQNLNNYHRFNGINGRLYKISKYEKSILISPKFKNKNGIIGCALSHYKLWQQLIKKNVDIALICEDDIEFVDNFNLKLQHLIIQMKKEKYDIIVLHNNIKKYEYDKISKIIHYNRLYWFGGGLTSYIINKKALKVLLEEIKRAGIYKEIDWFVYIQYKKLKIGFINIPIIKYSIYQNNSNIERINNII